MFVLNNHLENTGLNNKSANSNKLTISVASRILGVTPQAIRYWYRKGTYCEIFVKDARPPICYKDEVLKLKEMFKSDRKDYMTTDEAAEYLGVPLSQLCYWREIYPDLLYKQSMGRGCPFLYDKDKLKELRESNADRNRKFHAQYFTTQQAAYFLGVAASTFANLIREIKDKDIYAPENSIVKYKLYRKDKIKELAGKIHKLRDQYFTTQQAAGFLGISRSTFSKLVHKIEDKDIYAPDNLIKKYKLYRKDKIKKLKESREKKKST